MKLRGGAYSKLFPLSHNYALWFITGALEFLDLVVARRVLLEVHFALRLNSWTLAAVDKFGLLILGVIWLVLIWWTQMIVPL